MTTLYIPEEEAQQLRDQHYNAAISSIKQIHEDLWLFRVRPDEAIGTFDAGQYTSLGLGHWEPRLEGTQPEDVKEKLHRKVVKRAYSISCPILDEGQKLVQADEGESLEFYIVLVRENEGDAPALTPRLFSLGEGDRLWIGRKVTGHYNLSAVSPDDNVIFVATGTGEAPHNAMVAELLSKGHRGRLISIVCVRQRRDLGYLETHEQLEKQYAQYRFVPLTTREPENLDPNAPNYVGKIYVQQYFESGQFEEQMDCPLDPDKTHVYLCGNPDMISAPLKGKHATNTDGPTFPEKRGMCQMLHERGFTFDSKEGHGTIHYEEYW